MDWQKLAIETVAALIPFTPYAMKAADAIATELGKSLFSGSQKLYELVKKRLIEDSEHATNVLTRFEEDPRKYSGRLENLILDLVEQDPEFARQLQTNLDTPSAVRLIAIGRSFIEDNNIQIKGSAHLGIYAQDDSTVSHNTIDIDN